MVSPENTVVQNHDELLLKQVVTQSVLELTPCGDSEKPAIVEGVSKWFKHYNLQDFKFSINNEFMLKTVGRSNQEYIDSLSGKLIMMMSTLLGQSGEYVNNYIKPLVMKLKGIYNDPKNIVNTSSGLTSKVTIINHSFGGCDPEHMLFNVSLAIMIQACPFFNSADSYKSISSFTTFDYAISKLPLKTNIPSSLLSYYDDILDLIKYMRQLLNTTDSGFFRVLCENVIRLYTALETLKSDEPTCKELMTVMAMLNVVLITEYTNKYSNVLVSDFTSDGHVYVVSDKMNEFSTKYPNASLEEYLSTIYLYHTFINTELPLTNANGTSVDQIYFLYEQYNEVVYVEQDKLLARVQEADKLRFTTLYIHEIQNYVKSLNLIDNLTDITAVARRIFEDGAVVEDIIAEYMVLLTNPKTAIVNWLNTCSRINVFCADHEITDVVLGGALAKTDYLINFINDYNELSKRYV